MADLSNRCIAPSPVRAPERAREWNCLGHSRKPATRKGPQKLTPRKDEVFREWGCVIALNDQATVPEAHPEQIGRRAAPPSRASPSVKAGRDVHAARISNRRLAPEFSEISAVGLTAYCRKHGIPRTEPTRCELQQNAVMKGAHSQRLF